jgi:hypothetical protein
MIVSLSEPWELMMPMTCWRRHGVEALSIPVPDYGAPSLPELQRAVAIVVDRVKRFVFVL